MLRNAFSAVRNSRRFDVEMQSFELPGGRHHSYDWGYPPLAYHVKWHGETVRGKANHGETDNHLNEIDREPPVYFWLTLSLSYFSIDSRY